MSTVIPTEPPNINEDPLSHEHGAHPVATGVGAMGGGATGAAIGMTVGGPIGSVIGAVIGAVAGGFGGTAVGEQLSPTIEPEPLSSEATVDAPVDAPAYPLHEVIAQKAWYYYESEGRPEGQDLRHWLTAEKDLQESLGA